MGSLTRPIQQIESELEFYKKQHVQSGVEIGIRLIEAKSIIPYGEWGTWISKKGFSEEKARQYIIVAEEFKDSKALWELGFTKLLYISTIPEETRTAVIQNAPLEEMTTRQVQELTKQLKQEQNNTTSLEDKVKQLSTQIQELKNKPAEVVERVIEKTVIPGDYEQAKNRFAELTQKVNQKEAEIKDLQEKLKDSKDGLALKNQIDFLTKQKTDLSRQIQSATELSKLTVRLHDILKQELAPIKFSRCMEQLNQSDTAVQNLVEVVELVEVWSREIRGFIPNNNVIEMRVIK